ncbi:head-tail connector protein [Paracoccus tegillarcae]|nr:head-tail connector protein [Paracoccus tegillarcae]
MNTERTQISTAAPFELGDVKAHCRVMFDDDDWQIAQMADAAAREIEAHCGLALLAQRITVTLGSWCCRIPLPIGPIWTEGLTDHPLTVELIDEAGNVTPHPAGWWIEGDRYPVISLTSMGQGQHLRISYPAGYGTDHASIPADLQLAINDQAAAFYDQRGDTEGPQGLTNAAARIAARHRRVAV